LAAERDFGLNEILFSDFEDIIGIDTLMGFAAVEENCEDCKEPEHWCWNKEYSVFTGKVTNSRQTKRRRVGDNV
jgi:hypothetical protein